MGLFPRECSSNALLSHSSLLWWKVHSRSLLCCPYRYLCVYVPTRLFDQHNQQDLPGQLPQKKLHAKKPFSHVTTKPAQTIPDQFNFNSVFPARPWALARYEIMFDLRTSPFSTVSFFCAEAHRLFLRCPQPHLPTHSHIQTHIPLVNICTNAIINALCWTPTNIPSNTHTYHRCWGQAWSSLTAAGQKHTPSPNEHLEL